MKQRKKKVLTVVVFIIYVSILFVISSCTNHNTKLSMEEELFVPLGNMVLVNGNEMSVYAEGEGDFTILFMSGGGTCSPILDFRSLYSFLSDDYRIVVVEKFGYGFSDVVDGERDIDTMLSETREALQQADISGPFVLCPHSMSGIEALHWAKQYPDEVTAIVGLDMAVPETYENYNPNMPFIKLGQFIASMGITRAKTDVADGDAVTYGILTEEEKEIYRAVFYRRTATVTMINEVKAIKSNADKVRQAGIPNIPTLMFTSNGEGTGFDKERWQTYQSNYMKQIEKGEMIRLDCSHYIHDIEYERIANEIKRFLDHI